MVKKLSRGLEAGKTGRSACWSAEISANGEYCFGVAWFRLTGRVVLVRAEAGCFAQFFSNPA
jgi:hypothetical protein